MRGSFVYQVVKGVFMFWITSRSIFISSFIFILITSLVMGAPRQDQALIDVAYEAVCLAHQDQPLAQRITPLIGEQAIKLNGDQLRRAIAVVPRQMLEQVRNTLTEAQRRQLIGLTLRGFINPNAENNKYGTIYYAKRFEELCVGDATFFKNHKDFCDILNASAKTTSAISLGLSLKKAYEKVDNNTKAALKPELAQLGQLGYGGALSLLKRRISNNT